MQATLGRIPEHALAFGVVVDGLCVQLRLELTELTQGNRAVIDDIVDDFEMLTGSILEVTRQVEVLEQRSISGPGSPVWWLYLSRVDDEDEPA